MPRNLHEIQQYEDQLYSMRCTDIRFLLSEIEVSINVIPVRAGLMISVMKIHMIHTSSIKTTEVMRDGRSLAESTLKFAYFVESGKTM